MKIQIRFDGPPGPVPGRFIEVEDEHGASFNAGAWKQDGSNWLLVIDTDCICQFCDRMTLEKLCPRCGEEMVCTLCGSCGTDSCGYVMEREEREA